MGLVPTLVICGVHGKGDYRQTVPIGNAAV